MDKLVLSELPVITDKVIRAYKFAIFFCFFFLHRNVNFVDELDDEELGPAVAPYPPNQEVAALPEASVVDNQAAIE